MKILCVYCTRTGITEKIARQIAHMSEAELLCITDGKDHKGIFGYIGAAIEALRGKMPELKPIETKYPLEEYEKIVVAFPIWCEDVCIIAKSFLKKNGGRIKGKIYYVADHMSNLSYEKNIKALDELTGKKAENFLSVKTRKYDWTEDVNRYVGENLK